jgi:hypothetical protein
MFVLFIATFQLETRKYENWILPKWNLSRDLKSSGMARKFFLWKFSNPTRLLNPLKVMLRVSYYQCF